MGKRQYIELSKDIFIFSYLCGGINFTDIANLTHENIQSGRLHYIRQKTGKQIKIGIPQEAMRIIEKYSKQAEDIYFRFWIVRFTKPPYRNRTEYTSYLAKSIKT